jgi:hypothetical protein
MPQKKFPVTPPGIDPGTFRKMYINTVLIVIVCGCGTWSLILKEEQRVRLFQIYGAEEDICAEGDELPQHWGETG